MELTRVRTQGRAVHNGCGNTSCTTAPTVWILPGAGHWAPHLYFSILLASDTRLELTAVAFLLL